jgi:hypothetical protein
MDAKRASKSGVLSGTTGASYVEVLRTDTRGCGALGKILLMIKNTGASYDLKYKIDGYPGDYAGDMGGQSVAIKAETTLGESAAATNTDTDKEYAAVVVSVKSAESTPTAWQLDFCTY